MTKTTVVPKQSLAPRATKHRKPSDFICTHSSTAAGLYALEVLDRLAAAGKVTMSEVTALVAAYDAES